jgi:hypothetical protein
MVRLYIIGVSILLVAILFNFIISKLGIASWYDFINILSKNEPNNLSVIDYLWLFLFYPVCLGLGYLLGDFVSNLILR